MLLYYVYKDESTLHQFSSLRGRNLIAVFELNQRIEPCHIR